MAGAPIGCGAVLVVDDDAALRAVVRVLLDQAGYPMREAASGSEALELARRERPGVVLLDVCLPGLSGYEVCRELRDEFGDDLPIMFLSGVRTESYDRVAGLLIGADDYLAKPFAPDELLARVRRLIDRSTGPAPAIASNLTKRELEVLRLLADGLGQKEVAKQLFISSKTVATHIEHILGKLGVRSRAQAVALALRHDVV